MMNPLNENLPVRSCSLNKNKSSKNGYKRHY